MSFRPGKLILIILVPALAYGALKGILYFNAKRTVDDIVTNTAHMADIRYRDISTDLRGAVTVEGVRVQPLGYEDMVGVDSIRIASDDPMFFIRGGQWEPGGDAAPPNSLSFHITGMQVPLTSDLIRATRTPNRAMGSESSGACEQGMEIQPEFLSKMGFTELTMDMDARYRLDETTRTLEFGMNLDLHDIESVEFAATMTDVDVQALSQGAAPQFSLGRASFKMRVSPEFGKRALKTCAVGTDSSVDEWGRILADTVLEQLEQQGLSLGYGLSNALREFYTDWGEFEVVAAPSQPVGLLSLMFLSPNQLADTLSLRMSLNGENITDTSFTLQQPQGGGLAGMFGGQQSGGTVSAAKKKRRVMVRRSYEGVPVKQIADYVGHQVQVKPRGQPMREGLLRAVKDGEVEVQQALHGGKYSVHVPRSEIELLKVLVREEIPPKG